MAEAPPTDPVTPQDDNEDTNEPGEDDQNDVEDDATPSQASPNPSRSGTPRRRGRGRGSLLSGAKRRPGRPPKVRPPASEDDTGEAVSDAPPKRRGGFRGGNRGRWANHRKSGVSRQQPPPLDDDGNPMEVIEDEVVLPDIPEGEEKVDKNGVLLGGRDYRVRTFTILGRGSKLYMLSTEPARCIGFRDSYLFFQKHKHLYKCLIDEDEKKDLIERDLMPNSYKGRQIGVVSARSVFREFGAKIVIGGKKVTDDYDEQAARERGDIEGELADPHDRLPPPGEPYNRNQYVAWHGASQVYHTNLPNQPTTGVKGADSKRKRVVITGDNWMLEHARNASTFNASLAEARKTNFPGLYEIHTNTMQFPKHMQPTHGRWEKVKPNSTGEELNRLPAVEPVYTRSFRIHDFAFEGAPNSTFTAPGIDSDENGLGAIVSEALDELPPECLTALHEAQRQEAHWRSKWRDERRDGLRASFLPSVEWFPKT
jgi:chromatin structure-remodeling complex protein RSC7